MTLTELLNKAIALKVGNKEMLLGHQMGQKAWLAEIGNPVNCVSLGEVNGEYVAEGDTPEEAVENLLKLLEHGP